MLKLVSKVSCPRCENIKTYLDQNNIPYEVIMAEDKGYEFWRNGCVELTGKVGFPILIKGGVDEAEVWVNGTSEEIIEKIVEWYLTEKVEKNDISEKHIEQADISTDPNKNIKYDWAH